MNAAHQASRVTIAIRIETSVICVWAHTTRQESMQRSGAREWRKAAEQKHKGARGQGKGEVQAGQQSKEAGQGMQGRKQGRAARQQGRAAIKIQFANGHRRANICQQIF